MEDLSIESVKLLDLAKVYLVLMNNISDLLFNFKKLQMNQDFILRKQSVRDGGGKVELGFEKT